LKLFCGPLKKKTTKSLKLSENLALIESILYKYFRQHFLRNCRNLLQEPDASSTTCDVIAKSKESENDNYEKKND
jgi:hypothetical protein